jgi:hypothetical protein
VLLLDQELHRKNYSPTEDDTAALREDVAKMLAPMGLRLSPAKTSVVHLNQQ